MTRGFTFAALLAGALTEHVCLAQESAIEAARAASRAAPADAALSLRYGIALRRAGRTTEAAQELRRGTSVIYGGSSPIANLLHLEIARTAIDRRDFWGAWTECRSMGLKSIGGGAPFYDSASAPAVSHTCLAEAHLLWGRATEALPETALALANGNRSYDAKVAEGIAHELEVKDDEAEASFRQAISWSPERWEGHMYLGRLLVRLKRHDEGVAALRHALELDPNGPESLLELARALPANAESAGLLEHASHERAGYSPALVRLSEIDLELGRLEPAKQAAEAAIKSSPSEPVAYVVRGRVALTEGKPDEAIKAGQRALSLLSNSAPAKLLIADANAAKGEIDLAIEAYQATYGLDPGDPTPMVRASVACHAAGRDTSARAFGERATHDFPQWGPGWVAFGDALVAQGEIATAKNAYETALKVTGPVDAVSVRSKLSSLR